jgi:hypothetical protein
VLDLDSVYGAGPIASQQLYDPSDRAKLRIESGGKFEDLPRTADNTAILGDPRNDEHVIIAGLHAAFILFHKAVELLRSDGMSAVDVFARARRLTTWHYHWLVLHEFLPLIVGRQLVDDVLHKGPRFYRPKTGQAMIPVEFQAAVYRLGHSMVRPSYRANLKGDNGGPFFGMIFDPSQGGKADPTDLRGGARAARRFVGRQTFFDFGDGQLKPNKLIDTTLSTPLFYYTLKEAELTQDGLRLGPVGGRIVAEVLIGLLRSDPASICRWKRAGNRRSRPAPGSAWWISCALPSWIPPAEASNRAKTGGGMRSLPCYHCAPADAKSAFLTV